MQHSLTEYWDYINKNYCVPDLTTQSTEVLFIVESPHTDEMLMGVPLAGDSGKAISRVLFGSPMTPFGISISNNILANNLHKIGIANVSNIPLQMSPYPEKVKRDYAGFLYFLEKLRAEWKNKSFSDSRIIEIEVNMVKDFSRRLLSHKKLKAIVPCGKFAEHYVNLCSSHLTGTYIHQGIPHPSMGHWDKNVVSIRKELLNYFK